MDWKEVGKTIGSAAPALGTLIGGPAGGAIGALVASALGSEATPAGVSAAVANNPEAFIKLKQLEADHALELQKLAVTAEQNRLAAATAELQATTSADTSTLQAVNATMQSESHAEHWMQWAWRPVWGFVSAAAFFVVCGFVCYLMFLGVVGKDHDAMRSIPDLVSTFVELFAVPGAILGISAWGRNKLKLARAASDSGAASQ
jgi:hypothetical protein